MLGGNYGRRIDMGCPVTIGTVQSVAPIGNALRISSSSLLQTNVTVMERKPFNMPCFQMFVTEWGSLQHWKEAIMGLMKC